MHDGMQ